MDFEWEPEYTAFRDELRAFIAEWRTPELLKEYAESYGGGRPGRARARGPGASPGTGTGAC